MDEITKRRHWRRTPPVAMFFSDSSSERLMEEANTSRSAMAARRCRKLTATSTGSPCVGSTISNSLCAEAKKEKKNFYLKTNFKKEIGRRWWITCGEVADASKGSSPPQAMMRLSDSCDIKCTALTTKMALSPLLTNSSTDLVL